MPTFDMIDPGWSYSQRYTFSPPCAKEIGCSFPG
jgi:hypothetical protein